MKTGYSIGLLAAAAIIVLALSSAAVTGSDTPQIKHKEAAGNYLTDGKGMTLYNITKDKRLVNRLFRTLSREMARLLFRSDQGSCGLRCKGFRRFHQVKRHEAVDLQGLAALLFCRRHQPLLLLTSSEMSLRGAA